MLPDRVSNPGSLTYESGALPIALRGPAYKQCVYDAYVKVILLRVKTKTFWNVTISWFPWRPKLSLFIKIEKKVKLFRRKSPINIHLCIQSLMLKQT